MRFRGALWSLLLPVLAGAFLLWSPGSAPPAGASQGRSAPLVLPESCEAPLPLPSDFPFEKSRYEIILGRFLKAGCYLKLNWHHDKQVRPTGPTVAALGGSDPHFPSWVTTTLG